MVRMFPFDDDTEWEIHTFPLSSRTANNPSEQLAELDSNSQVGCSLQEFASRIGINLSDSDAVVSANDSEDIESCVFDVPLEQQQYMLREFLYTGIFDITYFIRDHWDEICDMARERHADGYALYGSRMYSWDAETRRRNIIEELADALDYMSSGDYGSSSYPGGKVE